jgi:hypothetical protein
MQKINTELLTAHSPAQPFTSRMSALWRYLAVAAKTCIRYHEAAMLYETLSRLDNAELRRRGLSRCNLAHDIERMASNDGAK